MGGDPQGHAISLYKENMIIYIFTVITVIFSIVVIIIIITVIISFLKQSCCTALHPTSYILLFIKLSKILTIFEVNPLHAKKRYLLMMIKISEVTLGFTSFHN